ncbi:hypothetical protein [Nocardia brasiliensis]|uniref:hypothetical protein n=1 Tax=Nocardia brasiliensis TaxID=37326 RepID=UPI00245630A4|nr:hypothetical protein [Nocardia brasiliensis]
MAHIYDGAWLVYPRDSEATVGGGEDALAVRHFGNSEASELDALRYANDNSGFHAVYVAPGESIADAEGHRT